MPNNLRIRKIGILAGYFPHSCHISSLQGEIKECKVAIFHRNIAEGGAELGTRQMNPPKWYERGSFFSFSMNNFFRLMTQFCSVLARISKFKAMRSIFWPGWWPKICAICSR